MRRNLINLLVLMLLIMQQSYSQQNFPVIEDFDGNTVSYTPTPSNSWVSNPVYHLSSLTGRTDSKSYLGIVPNKVGDTTFLTLTSPLDFSNLSYVQLRFSHICKISPDDIAKIQFKLSNTSLWQDINASFYEGGASNYTGGKGFNAASYSDWNANNIIARPQNSWWKEEFFDLSHDVAFDNSVELRFMIIHGSVPYTQASYGWLLENIQIMASTSPLNPPVVKFIDPLVQDTVYSAGPYEINAKVATTSTTPVQAPWLKYTVTEPGNQPKTDSILMTNVSGDSLWKATIGQYAAGTTVLYSITGRDANGNEAMALSEYIIMKLQTLGETGYVTVGTGTATENNPPFNLYYEYSWSRQLYLGTELSQNNTGGTITKLAWQYAYTQPWTYDNQSCYLKVVDDTYLSSNAYIDPFADGATLVWQGTIGATGGPDWVEIDLDAPFDVPPGKNLLVYWHHENGDYYSSRYEWYVSGSPNNNMAAYGEEDDSFDNAAAESEYSRYRANIRFYIVSNPIVNNSIETYSIDISDTILVSPSTAVPIKATFKNKGSADLDSAIVLYKVNNSAPVTQTIYWNPALLWDFNSQHILGNYLPKLNGNDTITVWTSMPNGQSDSITRDDMLVKVIYGSSDLLITFVDPPADTVDLTGPYEIKAAVSTLSGTPVNEVSLYVAYTNEGITAYDTLDMLLDVSDNLWKVNIPQQRFATKVAYAINLMDIYQNNVVLSNQYYIKRLDGFTITDYVIVGTDKMRIGTATPVNLDYPFSWSRQLYLGTEIFEGNTGGKILKLAWEYAYTNPWTYSNQICYFRAVDDNTVPMTAYEDPVSSGATMVWQGTIGANAAGWVEINLNTPFDLPAGKNLMVYWGNENGTYYGSAYSFYHTPIVNTMAVHGMADRDYNSAINNANVVNGYRPNARFYRTPDVGEVMNSVALESINSPQLRGNIVGTLAPVQVTILNKGMEDIDSCYINWTLNGVPKPAVQYKRRLPENFTDTITLGFYSPMLLDKRDTITVWVSMPNGYMDAISRDDTLTVIPIGCGPLIAGTYDVGTGNTYQTLDDILTVIYNCGVAGDINILLKGTYNERIDLSNLSDYMEGHTLTITSSDNHPDSATIRVTSGTAITLSNTTNVAIKAITIDAATATSQSYGIFFDGASSNILIRDCKILTNPTASNTTIAPISQSAGFKVDNVSIINNKLDGGQYGINFNGYTQTVYCDNILLDSNTITNTRSRGILIMNTNYTIHQNTILSRTENTTAVWYGILIEAASGDITNNRIIQLSSNITSSSGINTWFLNSSQEKPSTKKALIANNEIILYITEENEQFSGIYLFSYAQANVYNNSIYVGGTRGKGIAVAASPVTNIDVRNNNIVMQGDAAYPIYLAETGYLANWFFDYNNLYAPVNIAYAKDVAITTMDAWKDLVASDNNSVSLLPSFKAIPVFTGTISSLDLLLDTGLTAPMLSLATEDILGASRFPVTTIGCYTVPPMLGNASLTEITAVTNGSLTGQTENVDVVIYNAGATPLTDINLEWSINGYSQSDSNYQVSLQMGDFTTITIGSITYPSENVTIKVWINELNNGLLADEATKDDTISRSLNICPMGPYNGLLTIGGQTGMFPDVEFAFNNLIACGVSGDITFEFQPGVYDNINLLNSAAVLGNHKLIITSSSTNVDDVIIRPSSEAAITMGNSNNIEVRGITIDATNGRAGVQFASSCSNILIRDCKILTSQSATSTAYSGIYATTGVLDNIQIINNEFDGGYAGIYIAPQTSENIRIDSNTVTNTYRYGLYLQDATMMSILHNKITTGTRTPNTSFGGIYIEYANDSRIENNTILLNHANITSSVQGISVSDIKSFFIVNNEIFINCEASLNGFYIDYPVDVHIYHNTVYTKKSGTSGANYASENYVNDQTESIFVENNIFVAEGGSPNNTYAIYIWGTASEIVATSIVNYNNYYSTGNNIGYFGGNRSTLAIWKQNMRTDTGSVTIYPQFANPALNLSLAVFNDTLLCPVLNTVSYDIIDQFRVRKTTMGAYSQPLLGQDIMLLEVVSWNEKVFDKQLVQVYASVFNSEGINIDSATLAWSLNGQIQPSITHIFNPALSSAQQENVFIGNFTGVDSINTYDVKVWVEKVNGQADTININDTVYVSGQLAVLAEFAAPLIPDTITKLSFDVNVKIYEYTGAPVSTPQMELITIVNGVYQLQNSVSMSRNGDVWVAHIPQQYFNSQVSYWVVVSDTLGNIQTLTDSTYIKYMGVGTADSAVIIGTAISTEYRNPYRADEAYSFSKNYYRAYEIEPNSRGGFINSFAFYTTTSRSSNVDNVSFYFKAATDSTVISWAYSDPLLEGATLVWGSANVTTSGAGWVTFTLNTPFYLPPNMNLLIYCYVQDGDDDGERLTWRATDQSIATSSYACDDINPPTGSTAINGERPNLKISLSPGSEPYPGYNLALLSMVEPVNTSDICTPDYTPVKIAIANLGENDYSYLRNPVQVGIEINDPIGNSYTFTDILFTGVLESGSTNTIEIMSALPIMYSGIYDIKAWIQSSIDNVFYDDTIITQFVSGRIGLPVQEDFSNGMPDEFVSTPQSGIDTWKIDNTSTTILPDSGTGMLRFSGSAGSVARLSTKQLDLYMARNPFVEFFFYHDTSAAVDDVSNTDINVSVDGVEYNLATIYVRDPQGRHGWTRYWYSLSQFTANSACVLIQFESINRLSTSTQYIDYIYISSEEDAEVSEIIISPNVDICNRLAQDISIVIKTDKIQPVIFNNSAEILLDINGTIHSASLQGKVLQGNSSDTISILSNFTVPAGSYTMKAYFRSKADNNPANDTAKYMINMSPKFDIRLQSISEHTPAMADLEHKQLVTIINTGDVHLSDIGLILKVDDLSGYQFEATKDVRLNLAPSDSITLAFDDAYIVPWTLNYEVMVYAYLICDSTLANTSSYIQEDVDIDDLSVAVISNPVTNTIDAVNTSINVSIDIHNQNIGQVYDEGRINAVVLISDTNGNLIGDPITETLPRIAVAQISYTFNEAYTVPNVEKYHLTVYIENVDEYIKNDTLRIIRETDYDVSLTNRKGISFTLGQNIPNPAREITTINYSIPQDGEVNFQLYSVNGQLLHARKENAIAGNNKIELDIASYASGVYFYTMEYNGQRISKRMSITH